MEERTVKSIKRYLQDDDVRQRIQQNIQRGHLEATVTIGRVANLFDIKESKLRDWENRRLLKPARSKDVTGQRQYTPTELDKLAIIKELIDEGDFSPADIPENIEEIWNEICPPNTPQPRPMGSDDNKPEHKYIDLRIQNSYHKDLFWRYYASHVLRLSLMLICEDISFTRAGLIVPLRQKDIPASAPPREELPKVGESIVGWLGLSRSFYTFLTPAPEFRYASDFHILQLMSIGESEPKDNTLIVVPRMEAEARPLTLSNYVVETIRRLLEPLYNEVPDWNLYLGTGMRDLLDPLIDFNSGTNLPDVILTNIAERVVCLGGKTAEGQYRWRFCCILVPNNPQLPLQHRSLVIRAKTKNAPFDYKIGTTIVTPDTPILSVSLRAFQSGRIIYRHRVTTEDTSIIHHELEEPIGSAIAVPVGGEDGVPLAVMYIVSAEADAFSEKDQYLLRMVGRMVEELLMTYNARMQVIEKLADVVKNPGVVDSTFRDFASENEFINDVETLLKTILVRAARQDGEDIVLPEEEIRSRLGKLADEVVSFIAIDIDKLTSIATKYGDRMTKNLCRLVGQRIQGQLRVLFTNPTDCKLYHVYADRFYLLLKGISLEKAREKAELLRQVLNGSYQVDAIHSSIEQPPLIENLLVPAEIKARLGISSYPYLHLAKVLRRYPVETALASTSALIARSLDDVLNVGQNEGGDVVISWDPGVWSFIRLTPPISPI